MKTLNEELKKCIKVVNDLGEKLDKIINDGNVKWVSLVFFLVGKIKDITYFFKNIGTALDQYEQMDLVGSEDLKNWYVNDFDIANDTMEVKIEEVVSDMIDLVNSDFIRKFRSLLKKFTEFKRK